MLLDNVVSGSVQSVSVATANGLAGTVATPSTTPVITLKTSLASGILKSDGADAIALASGTDITTAIGANAVQNATLAAGLSAPIAESLVTGLVSDLAGKLNATQTLAFTGDVTAPATALNTGTIATALKTITQGNIGTSLLKFKLDANGRITDNVPVTSADLAGVLGVSSFTYAASFPVEGAGIVGSPFSTLFSFPNFFQSNVTLWRISLYLRDIPTGSPYTITLNNVTQGTSTTISVAADSNLGTNSAPGMSFLTTDTISAVITAVGSTNPGGTGTLRIHCVPSVAVDNIGVIPVEGMGVVGSAMSVLLNTNNFCQQAFTVSRLILYLRDAPVGSAYTIRVRNETTATQADVTVADSANSGVNASPGLSFQPTDTISITIIAIGSTNPGGTGILRMF